MLGSAVDQAPGSGVGQVAGGGSVGRVVAGHVPLGASDVVTVVVIHGQDVLHGQNVAVGAKAQILLDALGNDARLEQVDGVLHRVGGGAAGQVGQLVVDHHAETSEGRHFGLGHAHTAAAPDHGTAGGQCRGAEGQHPHLLEVVRHVGVHGDCVEFVAALTQLGLGGHNVCHVDEVGLGHRTGDASERLVRLVAAQYAGAADAAEQTQQLGCKGGGLQLVDGCGQLVADVSQGIGARAQLAEVVSGVGEATVEQGHDLLVGSHVLRGQITQATVPAGGGEDLGFGGGDGVEERHAHAGAAGTGIQGSVALDDAALHPLRLLEDALSGVLKELGASYEVREKSSPEVAVRSRHWLAPVESRLGRCPTGARDRLLLSTTGLCRGRWQTSSFAE